MIKPTKFFITKGSGSSPYEEHAGAFHMALYDAGIHKYNIQTYSSVLPHDYEIININDIELPEHGTVFQTITACMFGKLDEHISAGIIFAPLYSGEKKVGGLVCEVKGHYTHEELQDRLYKVINNLFERTYKTEGWEMGEPESTIECYTPDDVYGCCLVSIVFVEHLSI